MTQRLVLSVRQSGWFCWFVDLESVDAVAVIAELAVLLDVAVFVHVVAVAVAVSVHVVAVAVAVADH